MRTFSESLNNKGFLSKVDVRVKLFSAFVLLSMVLSYKGFIFPLLVSYICLLTCLAMRVPPRVLILRFSEPVFIALVAVALKLLFSGTEVMFSVEVFGVGITAHRDGLMEGLMIAGRVMAAVSIVAVIGFATPFTEFMAALSWFRVPKGLIEISLFAYRYIFVLLEDSMVIYNAQKIRLGYSTVGRGVKSFGILAGSLILKAFDNGRHTATAMIQRGYDGKMPVLRHEKFKLSEIVVSVVFLTIMGIAWRM